MVLISRILGPAGDAFWVEVDVTPASAFYEDGGIPAWVGIEYMAQAVAAYAGYGDRPGGGDPEIGLLLAVRDFETRTARFPVGATLRVSARRLFMQEGGLSVLECAIHAADGARLASAQLTVVRAGDAWPAGMRP